MTSVMRMGCACCCRPFDNVHRAPKVFPTCMHTCCSQCICEVSYGLLLICPHNESCTSLALPNGEFDTRVGTIAGLPNNIPALTESLIARICSNAALCDSPFCIEGQTCMQRATSLFKPKSILLCQNCLAYGRMKAGLNNDNTQALSSLFHDADYLKKQLSASRKNSVDCPLHEATIMYYCKTCHQGICQECLPEHRVTKSSDGITTLFQHNVKRFDSSVTANEVGFMSAYARYLRDYEMHVLPVAMKLYEVMGKLWQAGLLHKLRLDARVLAGFMEESVKYCSAQELCALRPWVRSRGYEILWPISQLIEGLPACHRNAFEDDGSSPGKCMAMDSRSSDVGTSPGMLVELSPQPSLVASRSESELGDDNDDDDDRMAIRSRFGAELRRSNSVLLNPNEPSNSTPTTPTISPAISVTNLAKCFRHRLYFKTKIGQMGDGEGEFSEPNGLAVTADNLLVACDSNNHRVQLFEVGGRFVKIFGKETEGFWYPHRVAVCSKTGYVYVAERPPMRLVQMFTPDGLFMKQFAKGDVQHPRGICCDHNGYVFVLQGLVMTVTIYEANGKKLHCFSLLSDEGDDKNVAFPTSICVNRIEEIFISDNTKHAIFVYSYEGVLKRVISPGKDVICFPIGLAINHKDELVVCDNHETFNITILKQDGRVVRGFKSRVKHSGVLDCCLVDWGRSVAMSCRDYKIYVYNYEGEDGRLPRRRWLSRRNRKG